MDDIGLPSRIAEQRECFPGKAGGGNEQILTRPDHLVVSDP